MGQRADDAFAPRMDLAAATLDHLQARGLADFEGHVGEANARDVCDDPTAHGDRPITAMQVLVNTHLLANFEARGHCSNSARSAVGCRRLSLIYGTIMPCPTEDICRDPLPHPMAAGRRESRSRVSNLRSKNNSKNRRSCELTNYFKLQNIICLTWRRYIKIGCLDLCGSVGGQWWRKPFRRDRDVALAGAAISRDQIR